MEQTVVIRARPPGMAGRVTAKVFTSQDRAQQLHPRRTATLR
jgi:hypothetical protein